MYEKFLFYLALAWNNALDLRIFWSSLYLANLASAFKINEEVIPTKNVS